MLHFYINLNYTTQQYKRVKTVNVLSLTSQYILSLLFCCGQYGEISTSEIQSKNTKMLIMTFIYKIIFLSIYEQCVHYSGIKLFNTIPYNI
jgi:cellobiose-specific phosphotransferase system component IIC